MPIQILPARLANQIAAGEVVERPASVVKELVENSLDSGAKQIDIEIDKGGHKRILIRDNGSGIPKTELGLALSRHATSKICTLDDLEHIGSLGFRGEALASISSVARLTLSSKPAEQQEAWQAHCEGRDMEVKLNPVAHPNGSSVDVSDLFFNTPARRKFLRAEKTEFSHIDEIVRRIALSRFDVSFTLKHNDKLLRKYPLAENSQAKQRRLVAICGKDFSEQAIELNSHYQDFCLHGWLAPPETAKLQVDCQYFYVNGRMMRDKLLNHAVRQALEGVIAPEHQLAYVLYFTLDLAQVDVNVHPAKHEVRFHQSRLVHDFIFRALSDALNQYFSHNDSLKTDQHTLPPIEPNHDYIRPVSHQREAGGVTEVPVNKRSSFNSQPARQTGAAFTSPSNQVTASLHPNPNLNMKQAGQHYQTLMSTKGEKGVSTLVDCMKVSDKHMLVVNDDDYYLLAIKDILEYQLNLTYAKGMPVCQPLLLPISIEGDSCLLNNAEALQDILLSLNIDITRQAKRIILRKIPAGLRHFDWSQILVHLLSVDNPSVENIKQCLIANLAKQSQLNDDEFSSLWQIFCNGLSETLKSRLESIGKKVPLQEWLNKYV